MEGRSTIFVTCFVMLDRISSIHIFASGNESHMVCPDFTMCILVKGRVTFQRH